MNAFEERAKLVAVHDAICRKGQPSNHDFMGCAVDGIDALKDHAESLEKQNRLLSQVALEAIRLIHGAQLGDQYSHETCPECELGGEGALRDALIAALGDGYARFVWGNDMNIDREAWDEALTKQAEAAK